MTEQSADANYQGVWGNRIGFGKKSALLIVAGRGGVIQTEDEAEIRQLQPAILIARVENAGHMIPWDNLPGFFAAFGDFLGTTLN